MLHDEMFFNNNPFQVGKNPGLTDTQKAKQKLDAEWDAIGRASADDKESKDARVTDSLRRHFSDHK